MWEHGNIGQCWKGRREERNKVPPWDTLSLQYHKHDETLSKKEEIKKRPELNWRTLINGQTDPTSSNMLDDVALCWTRWPNECNMLDSTLRLERSRSKIYPESLENKCAPYWFAQKIGSVLVYRYTGADTKNETIHYNRKLMKQ